MSGQSSRVTISGTHPAPSSTTTLQALVVTMSDRKRAFEGNGDSNVSKKLKRFVFLFRNLARPTLMFAILVCQL